MDFALERARTLTPDSDSEEYLQIKLELGSEIFRSERESEFFDGFEMDDLIT